MLTLMGCMAMRSLLIWHVWRVRPGSSSPLQIVQCYGYLSCNRRLHWAQYRQRSFPWLTVVTSSFPSLIWQILWVSQLDCLLGIPQLMFQFTKTVRVLWCWKGIFHLSSSLETSSMQWRWFGFVSRSTSMGSSSWRSTLLSSSEKSLWRVFFELPLITYRRR